MQAMPPEWSFFGGWDWADEGNIMEYSNASFRWYEGLGDWIYLVITADIGKSFLNGGLSWAIYFWIFVSRQVLDFFLGSWFYAFLLLWFSAFLFFCFAVFPASLLLYFFAFLLLFLFFSHVFLLLYFLLLCFFASCLYCLFVFHFLCFILFCLYPKWNPRETLGEIQRNPKEILIRNPTWSPKWTLKKPHINQWNPKETLNPKQHAEKN